MLETALTGVETEIRNCIAGQPSVSNKQELEFIAIKLREMLNSIAIEQKIEVPGLWRIVTDTWPYTHMLRQQIVEAEYAYERLK